jgi:hypothetical protein
MLVGKSAGAIDAWRWRTIPQGNKSGIPTAVAVRRVPTGRQNRSGAHPKISVIRAVSNEFASNKSYQMVNL